MPQQQPRRKVQSSKARPEEPAVSIPDKLYFRIGDVAQLCSLQAYVLRYWETEFPQLKPNKGGTGQRLYRKRDVELVLEIKRLLYSEGFTIAGARRLLAEKRRSGVPEAEGPLASVRGRISSAETAAGAPVASTADGPLTAASGIMHPAATPLPAPVQQKGRQKLGELRREMRELLSILGADEAKPQPGSRAKRETKKDGAISNEPTLFE
ncbi:MAG: MerR family transcriptional regulator [Acidobacteriaceae bacterium]